MRVSALRVTVGALLAALALCAAAGAEVVQENGLRVSFKGKVAPHALPRQGTAPVAVTLGGEISTNDGSEPPQLTTITVAINRSGKLDYQGLPACRYHQIQPASTREAVEACPDSVVGRGSFRAAVALPEQSPFPSQGKIVAFNGNLHGERVLFAHIYGTVPLPQSTTVAFHYGRGSGAYGLTLNAELPQVAAEWGHVSGLELTLGHEYRYRGRERSYLSAGCAAPAGFPGAIFPFARASFGFDDGRVLAATMTRSCSVEKTKR